MNMPIKTITLMNCITIVTVLLSFATTPLSAAPLQDSTECFDSCTCKPSELIDFYYYNTDYSSVPHYSGDAGSLDMSHGHVNTLGADAFAEYTNLETLVFDNNGLQEIDKLTFYDLRQLKRVSLADNRLQTLEPSLFESSVELKALSLRGNPLTVSASSPLIESESLVVLDLSMCNLSEVFVETFAGTPYLRVLDLSHNRLTSLPDDLIEVLDQLEKIYLHGNLFPCGPAYEKMVRDLGDKVSNHPALGCVETPVAVRPVEPALLRVGPTAQPVEPAAQPVEPAAQPVEPKVTPNEQQTVVPMKTTRGFPPEEINQILVISIVLLLSTILIFIVVLFAAFWKDWIRFSMTKDPGMNRDMLSSAVSSQASLNTLGDENKELLQQ